MFRMSETVFISRSAADVFEFVSDLRNFPLWRAHLVSSTIVSEQVTGVGARCEEKIGMGPGRIPATCQITALDPGGVFSFAAVSPGLRYDGHVSVDSQGDGCTFTLSGEVNVSGFLRLLEPVIKRRMQAGVKEEVAAVQAHMG